MCLHGTTYQYVFLALLMVAAVATSFKVSLVFFSADFNAYKISYTHLYKSHCIHNNFRVIMCYIYHTKYHIISQSLKKISHYSCEVLVADLSWSINRFLLFFCSCFFLIKIPVKKWRLIFRHSVLTSLSNSLKILLVCCMFFYMFIKYLQNQETGQLLRSW